jgi:hypothetical protein
VLWGRWSGLTGKINQLPDSAPVGGLLLFAAGAADSLSYLADLDARAFGPSRDLLGYHEDIIDLAHARWACGTALTSVDLSAAALGRLCFGPRQLPTGAGRGSASGVGVSWTVRIHPDSHIARDRLAPPRPIRARVHTDVQRHLDGLELGRCHDVPDRWTAPADVRRETINLGDDDPRPIVGPPDIR